MKLWIGLALGLVVFTALVFSGVVGHDLLSWDDDVFLYQNPRLQPPSLANALSCWTSAYPKLYVPVTYNAWIGLAAAFGRPGPQGQWEVSPAVYHTANLMVHLLNVLFVFALLRLLVRHDWAAAAGALLFAIHPLQVEPVAWASELKDLLGGAFGLLALWLYLLRAPDTPLRRARAYYGWAIVAFVLAMLSKPNTVTLPLLAMLLEWHLYRRPWRQMLLSLAPWLGLALVCAAVNRFVQPVFPELWIPAWGRPFVAGDSLAFYLGKLVWPLKLSPDYGRTPQYALAHWWVFVNWLAPAAALALAWWQRRRWPWLLVSLGFFYISLLPVLGLVAFDFQQYSTVADHYAYVALFGPALALAMFLTRVLNPRWGALVGLVLLLLSFQSLLQTLTWENNLTFWNHTLEVNPRSFLAHNNLGAFYQLLGKPDAAIKHYEQGLALKPEDPDSLINLGLALYSTGQGDKALSYLQQGLWKRPGDPKAALLVGSILLEQKKPAEALPHFEGLAADPRNFTARFGLARTLAALGRRDEAAAQLRSLLQDAPGYQPAAAELKRLSQP